MLPSSLEQLRVNYHTLATLYAELQLATTAYPVLPVDRLCLSLQELHFRIQKATLATELAMLLDSDERTTERLLTTAIEHGVGFDPFWSALLRVSRPPDAA